ncbi:hypothetical protein CFC21_020457 [Triticum aestivum]|uniref:VWFA domain-containing protein n=2 Tax=Triticum aestivum TaxID=4565 RepID=A0A3B6BYV9_WHEAT|nr:uncharacterized protein LOC123039822 [Triticum aestivum]KAF7005332.1 hypothetical protein CFC21_020457 [Triticum aestivum]
MSGPVDGRTEKEPLAVVIVYAFDCTTSTPDWYKVDNVFWLVQEKLTRIRGSSLGYTYVMSTPNTYTSDMKLVDSAEINGNGYKSSPSWKRTACVKNMTSGLYEAHRLINENGNMNAIILLFSDGLVNKGDFFDGAEDFLSSVPVYTFTLGGNAYNQGLRTIAANSPGGMFSPLPLPDFPSLSAPFSQLLDNILNDTTMHSEKNPSPTSGRWPLNVVIVSAFDCTTSTPAWNKVNREVYWLVQKKLTQFVHSCLGYTYVMSTPNTYTSEMKLVDPMEIEASGYPRSSAWRRDACTNNMAAGLIEAHRLISEHGHLNGIILLFSDGLINKGDFFDGVQGFISKVPVHTFTLGGDAYNQDLFTIAINSPGGTFHTLPVPEKPSLSVPFLRLVDTILSGAGKWPLDVVIVYAFDSTTSTPDYKTVDNIFWLVQEKLIRLVDSCLGYTYVMSTPNTCTSDRKIVDSTDTELKGYKRSPSWRRSACTKNMASGLFEAHKLISYRGHWNSIILLFSDGLINKGDYFDGAEDFVSKVPVHTFTLGGDANNHVLHAMAKNSPGGMFHPLQVPDKPNLPAPFSQLLDNILNGTTRST